MPRMAKWLPPLGVCALALLLLAALVAAACEPDAPTTAPVPTATTAPAPTPTTAPAPTATPTPAPTATPTPAPTATPTPAPTATPTPAPTATTAPVLRQTSSATERYALTALYHATDGGNWTGSYNWLSDAPIGEWFGVRTDYNGRVVELRLMDN